MKKSVIVYNNLYFNFINLKEKIADIIFYNREYKESLFVQINIIKVNFFKNKTKSNIQFLFMEFLIKFIFSKYDQIKAV